MTRRRQSGFSVLEALAALAIVAVAMIPLLSLQTQVSRDFIHQRALREQISAQRNALAMLRDLNVMREPAGLRQLGPDTAISWSAAPLSALTRSTRQGSGDGEFEVRLYRVQVTITLAGAAPHTFAVDQIGWRALAGD